MPNIRQLSLVNRPPLTPLRAPRLHPPPHTAVPARYKLGADYTRRTIFTSKSRCKTFLQRFRRPLPTRGALEFNTGQVPSLVFNCLPSSWCQRRSDKEIPGDSTLNSNLIASLEETWRERWSDTVRV